MRSSLSPVDVLSTARRLTVGLDFDDVDFDDVEPELEQPKQLHVKTTKKRNSKCGTIAMKCNKTYIVINKLIKHTLIKKVKQCEYLYPNRRSRRSIIYYIIINVTYTGSNFTISLNAMI